MPKHFFSFGLPRITPSTPRPAPRPAPRPSTTGGKAARLRRQRAETARLQALADAAAKEQTAAARLSDAFTPAIPTGLAPGEQRAFQQGFTQPAPAPSVRSGLANLPSGLGGAPAPLFGAFQAQADARQRAGGGLQASQAGLQTQLQAGGAFQGFTPTGGGRGDPRQFGIDRPDATTGTSPATVKQLSYLDSLRETDPERALEVARFQSATIGRNTPESALATNVFFTEHAIFDQGQIPRNASEGVWNVIAERAGFEGTGAELLESLGYVPIGGGLWFLPDGEGGGRTIAEGGGAFRPVASRAPVFSGQPGRFSGARGASFGLTSWRI